MDDLAVPRMIRRILLLWLGSLLAGCLSVKATTSRGQDFDAAVAQRIEKGKTTAAQVLEWLGQPFGREWDLETGSEAWSYLYVTYSSEVSVWSQMTGAEPSMAAPTRKELILLLANGIVQSAEYSEGTFESTLGVDLYTKARLKAVLAGHELALQQAGTAQP
jgi:outer membrane protein assembly factor BamE (lipoprotein component of BamABCDE complex)